jgi:hypothetical protein
LIVPCDFLDICNLKLKPRLVLYTGQHDVLVAMRGWLLTVERVSFQKMS